MNNMSKWSLVSKDGKQVHIDLKRREWKQKAITFCRNNSCAITLNENGESVITWHKMDADDITYAIERAAGWDATFSDHDGHELYIGDWVESEDGYIRDGKKLKGTPMEGTLMEFEIGDFVMEGKWPQCVNKHDPNETMPAGLTYWIDPNIYEDWNGRRLFIGDWVEFEEDREDYPNIPSMKFEIGEMKIIDGVRRIISVPDENGETKWFPASVEFFKTNPPDKE